MTASALDRTNEPRLQLLRLMIDARALDRTIGAADAHWHSSFGEEAIPVGCFTALEPSDYSLSHYRSAVIASMVRGADVRRLMAGVLGKVTGPGRGRPRAELTGDLGPNHFGMFSGTLGPFVGYATGAALASKLDGASKVALATFGEGTLNSGMIHETMNLASVLKLPVIFVCQDNQYAITTRSDFAVAGSVLERGSGYGMPAVQVDGNDAVAVFSAVSDAVGRARAGEGPSFVHALSYRLGGHWANDPASYRKPDEVVSWAARDPIAQLSGEMVSLGLLQQSDVAEMEADAVRRMEAALALAEADPWPDALDLNASAYAPQT